MKKNNKTMKRLAVVAAMVLLVLSIASLKPKNATEKKGHYEDLIITRSQACKLMPGSPLCLVYRTKVSNVVLNETSENTVSANTDIASTEGGMGGHVQDENGNKVRPIVVNNSPVLSTNTTVDVKKEVVKDNNNNNKEVEYVIKNDSKEVNDLWTNPTVKKDQNKKEEKAPQKTTKTEEVKPVEVVENTVKVEDNTNTVDLSERAVEKYDLSAPENNDNNNSGELAATVEEEEVVVEEEVKSSSSVNVYEMSEDELWDLIENHADVFNSLSQEEQEYVKTVLHI